MLKILIELYVSIEWKKRKSCNLNVRYLYLILFRFRQQEIQKTIVQHNKITQSPSNRNTVNKVNFAYFFANKMHE